MLSSLPPSLPRIFVQIASYRDRECQWTLRDLFAKAAHPERVFAGVLWQYVPEEDADCFMIETRPEQVRRMMVHARDSQGVCWARHLAQRLWQDEEFVLQIDSHSRFEAGWDELLLEQWAACRTPRALLSSYPPSYMPPDKIEPAVTYMVSAGFNDKGIAMMRAYSLAPADAPADPRPGAFVSAGFLFGPGAMIIDAPYDPYLYFHGEEISLAVRLWTAGWDFFAPSRPILYHLYNTEKTRELKVRGLHWEDHRDWSLRDRRSLARVRHLLSGETCDDAQALRELDRYGLGKVRTLAEYEAFSGLRFATRQVEEKALKGFFG